MQKKLWLKDEKLKQLMAVVFDSEADSEHSPHQESKAAAGESPLQQTSDSFSLHHVCFVDNTPNLWLTSITFDDFSIVLHVKVLSLQNFEHNVLIASLNYICVLQLLGNNNPLFNGKF